MPSNTLSPTSTGPKVPLYRRAKIQIPSPGRGLVGGQLRLHDQPGPMAAVAARKGTLAVPGHREELQGPPFPRPGGMEHRLPQLGLLVGVRHEVGLVDDIDQGTHLDDAPEHAIDTQADLPLVLSDIAVHEQVGFSEIGVRAFGIPGVVSEIGESA